MLDRVGLPVGHARLLRADVVRVDDADVEGRVREHGHLPGASRPDEARVLADVDAREAIARPELAPVTEGASRKPQLPARGVRVLPAASVAHVVEEQAVDAAHLRARA